jgi:hypothetical protein
MQAENFHNKKWFKADDAVHGYNGPLDIEPHDLVSYVDASRVQHPC